VQAGKTADVRSNFISQVERGQRGMTWTTLLRLLDAYDATLYDLARAHDAER